MNEFARNKVLREEVLSYIKQVIASEGVERMFNREPVDHIADAQELIIRAFDQMEVDFAPIKENKSLNEAR